MTHRRRALELAACAMAILLAGAGCSSVEVVPERFYRLDPPRVAKVATRGHRLVRVDDFSVAPHLQSDRITCVIDRWRVEPHTHDLWAAPLDRLITAAVIQGLEQSGRFKLVLDNHDSGRADWALAGRVLSFEETGNAGRWSGRARIAFVLRDERTDKLLWKDEIAAEVPSPSPEPQYAVAALNLALGKVLSELVRRTEKFGDAFGVASPK